MQLTIAHPYYNNEALIRRNMTLWSAFPDKLRRVCLFLLIDDGSAIPLKLKPDVPMNLCIARVTRNIPWNQPGARNLAMSLTPTEWCYIADLDHTLTIKCCNKLLDERLNRDTVYFFKRRTESGEDRGSHISSFCIHKYAYWQAGGFDEDFCGHYGWDDFLLYDIFKQKFTLHTFDEYVTYYDKNKTEGLNRSARWNKYLIRFKRWQLARGRYKNKRVLRFPWEMVSWYHYQ